MKKIIVLSLALWLSGAVYAQPKKKPTEKAPTQKEMQDMMKQAQEMLEQAKKEMSPEERRMIDSMGIQMPDMKKAAKQVSGITDAQLKDAYENSTAIVPKKNTAKIAAIPPAIGNAQVGSYIAAVQNKAAALLSKPARDMADKVYDYVKVGHKTPAQAGTIAAGLWVLGKQEMSFYMMGKVCADDPTNTDNVSNYASMLSMMGAQNMAIPLLNNLNARFRQNSTILNNLGQAWFGLGDIAKAEKYIDSTIRIYDLHPQANMTKAAIEQSRGNISKAVQAVKNSMKHSYSKAKEAKLNELGAKMATSDYRVPGPKKADPMNLGGFQPPPFPLSVEQCIILEPQWSGFRKEIDQRMGQLGKQKQDLDRQIQQAVQQQVNDDIPIYHDRAAKKMAEVTELYNKKLEEFIKTLGSFRTEEGSEMKKNYEAKMDVLREKDLEQTGEGLPNKDFCPQYKATTDEYLQAFNSKMENFYKEFLRLQKDYLNESAYWHLYMETPEMFESFKLTMQLTWLDNLKGETPGFVTVTQYNCQKKEPGDKMTKLQKFDDVACKYKSKLDLYVFQIESNCSSLTGHFETPFFEYTRREDFERAEGDTYVSSTVRVTAGKSVSKDLGPVTVEAGAEVSVEVELGPDGVDDVSVTGKVEVKVGTDIIDSGHDGESAPPGKDSIEQSVEAGVEGRISITSGKGSVSGTGVLENLIVK